MVYWIYFQNGSISKHLRENSYLVFAQSEYRIFVLEETKKKNKKNKRHGFMHIQNSHADLIGSTLEQRRQMFSDAIFRPQLNRNTFIFFFQKA